MNKTIQDSGFSARQWSRIAFPLMGTPILLLAAYCILPTAYFVKAAPAANVQSRPVGAVTDTPAIAITNATATTSATPTTQREEKRFAVRSPIALRPSNERKVTVAMKAAATIHRTLCQGRGVQTTTRIRP